jgi:hypothetical protein
MDPEILARTALGAFERAVPAAARHRFALVVDPARTADALWPDLAAGADYALAHDGTAEIRVFGGLDEPSALEAAVAAAVEAAAGALEIRAELGEDALFEAHACFRADAPVVEGFYRAGEPILPGVYGVDLDLFVELRVPVSTWADLRGRRLVLALDEDGIELEVPMDAEPEEIMTLPGAGLLEADETLEEEDVMPSAGDLHVIPIVF